MRWNGSTRRSKTVNSAGGSVLPVAYGVIDVVSYARVPPEAEAPGFDPSTLLAIDSHGYGASLNLPTRS